MHNFRVTTDQGHEHEVAAEYHSLDDDFLTFKTTDHKQVASFNKRWVVSVVRLDGAPVDIGHVTIKVTPEIDTDEWARLIKRAAHRLGTA